MLVSTTPTLTLAPSRMRQLRRKVNGTSPGQHAVVAARGREISIGRLSGDEFISFGQPLVTLGAKNVVQNRHRLPAFDEGRVERRRREAKQIRRAKVRNHAALPQRS